MTASAVATISAGAAERGDQTWRIENLASISSWYHDDSQIGFAFIDTQGIDGPMGVTAHASLDCTGNCWMYVDEAENWYQGTGSPGSSKHDAWSVVAHEMGHWFGLEHPSDDGNDVSPSSDPGDPVMHKYFNYGEVKRGLFQDDVNGFRRTRSTNNTLANASFEYTTPFYGWKTINSPNGTAQSARYCGGGAQLESCFVQFNGSGTSGASIYQDVIDYGFHGTTPWNQIFAWLRADGPAAQNVTVAVFDLDAGTNVNTNCLIPHDGQWHQCNVGSNFVLGAGHHKIRYQVINYSSDNVSVDTVRLH